jgi:hypothetical protein
MAGKKSRLSRHSTYTKGESHGSISEISALEPPPTATGLVIVSSSNVHFSPLKPQEPEFLFETVED